MSKIETLADVPNVAPLNGNNDKIEAAFQNTLSRDGSSPNDMEANLDMNGNRILNLPDAVHNQEPITLAQAAGIASVSVAFSRENVGAALYPRTDAEITAGVTPSVLYFPQGDIRRYGAVGDGITDCTVAVTNAGLVGEIFVPEGLTFIVNSASAEDVLVHGTGTLKKKASTTSPMLVLTGDNTIKDVTLDGNWTNVPDAAPYSYLNTVRQIDGTLTVRNANFVNSFQSALRVEGASLFLHDSKFSGGAPHNDLSGGLERVTHYLYLYPTLNTPDTARVLITNNSFVGPHTSDQEDYFLNPSGLFINAYAVDGKRYEHVGIHDNLFEGTGMNAGAGNYTAPIETYNGVKNCSITGNTIRKYSYLGIKVQNSENVVISGNIVEDGYSGANAYTPDIAIGILVSEKQRAATAEQVNVSITGNVIDKCQSTGIYSNVDRVSIVGNTVSNITSGGVADHGIWTDGKYAVVANNVVFNHREHAIYTTGDHTIIRGNVTSTLSGNNDICIFFKGNHVQVCGNNVTNPGVSNNSPGIRTQGPASNLLIEGNTLYNLLNGIDIRVTDGAVDNVTIANNTFDTVTNKVLVNSAVTNVSAVTRGFTASRTDGSTVSHGHPTTPTSVRVTPSVAGEFVSVTAISSTTFTVAIKKHDNTAGTSQTLYWEVSS